MKNLLFAVCLIALVSFVSGCSSLNMSQISAPVQVRVEAPVKADLKVGEKISGESSQSILFGLFTLGGGNKFVDGVDYGVQQNALGLVDPVSKVKAAAAYDAVSKSGADVIVAPKYKVEVTSYLIYKTIVVTVNGYKGTIESIK